MRSPSVPFTPTMMLRLSRTLNQTLQPRKQALRLLNRRQASSVAVDDVDQALNDWTSNPAIHEYVKEYVSVFKPDRVHFVDGTDSESDAMVTDMVNRGTLIKLNEEKRPNSYLARSDKLDVARVEKTTYICSEKKRDAGITNNWREPKKMRQRMLNYFDGSMKGRTMYVIPFSMGPVGSDLSSIGVQLTDSPYVTQSMKVMTRIGAPVLDVLGEEGDFIKAVHSLGAPLKDDVEDVPWPHNPKKKFITHFPETGDIMSYGSGYGGNALLGKKCFALRIASILGRENQWMAEHMLILGVTNPEGVKKYVAAAFPSACGKTNFAMMKSKLPGWKIECVGDDIAWMRLGDDGRLRAINPENGFFGVAPGTGYETNPHAMDACRANTIFTNVALQPNGDVWWKGMTPKAETPEHLQDWLRRDWFKGVHDENKAAHPNSRFCCPASQCPIIDPDWENPEGVPIDAIIFGSRRPDTVPLVYQSLSWEHGTYLGATMSSEPTAAAEADVGMRNDPFAMKPFAGYNMGDYMQHWLDMGELGGDKMPNIFYVNWFQRDAKDDYIWPGFGDNARVLKWIFERCDEKIGAKETPIGYIPDVENGDLDLSGLDLEPEVVDALFKIDPDLWETELTNNEAYLRTYKRALPKGIKAQLELVKSRFKAE